MEWPSTLPPCRILRGVIDRVAAAGPDLVERMWGEMSDKPSGVAEAQAAATDIGLALNTVEGFPVRQIDWDSKPRFFIVEDSLSCHCCFEYTVCDRTKPKLINGEHYDDEHGLRYETVCECFDQEEAILVCSALNAYTPEVK